MAHFAELDANNLVLRVIVVSDEHEADGEVWCARTFGGRWKKTSYNTRAGKHPSGKPFRKNYAGRGYTYDVGRDAFIPPKPSALAKLNEQSCQWEEPKTNVVTVNGNITAPTSIKSGI